MSRTFPRPPTAGARELLFQRFLFTHLEMVQMNPTYAGNAHFLRISIFIGNGNENCVALVAPTYNRAAWGDEESTQLLKFYDKQRKWLQSLKWDGVDHLTAHRDWLFRAKLPASSHEVMELGKLLQPWGVDPQRLWELTQQ